MASRATALASLSAVAAALLAIILAPALRLTWSPWKWSRISADLVVMNATIYTSDPSLPFAQAMAVRGGRILRVGSYSSVEAVRLTKYELGLDQPMFVSHLRTYCGTVGLGGDKEEGRRGDGHAASSKKGAVGSHLHPGGNRTGKYWLNSIRTGFSHLKLVLKFSDASSEPDCQDLVGQETYVLNLNGKVVMPGFIDSHLHLIYGGLQMGQVELRGVKSQEEFARKVKEALRDKLHGEWILGSGWNNDLWGGELPLASWIDGITPDNPVWLSRMDGHMGLANSLALKIAGISNSTCDPIGGAIVKTLEGEPSGLLVDSAMKLVLAVIPEVSIHDRRDSLIRASKYALTRGVTTVIDFGRFFPGTSVDHIWQDFSGNGQILDVMFGTISVTGGMPGFETAQAILPVKSAILLSDSYGLQVTDINWLQNATLHSDKFGLQVAIHAIGDKANDMVLDMYNTVVSYNGMRDRRFRIEHAQHLVPGSTIRFGEQRIIASVQPDHLLDDANSAERKIGTMRAQRGSYLFRSLIDSDAILAFGSDWPVADINPLGAIKLHYTEYLQDGKMLGFQIRSQLRWLDLKNTKWQDLIQARRAAHVPVPDRIVCHADSFYIGHPVPVLSIDDELLPGQAYFVLPIDKFSCHDPLTAVSLASLSSGRTKPSLAGNGESPFEYVKGEDGRLLIKVLPEFITKVITSVEDGQTCGSDGGTLCTTPELRKHYSQLVGPRDHPWSPKLETISETRKRTSAGRLSPVRLLGLQRRSC
ncbi:Amidohydrolase family [Musa troglodytarum]|uniref:Amidohydrolase family n=1 Tax=Musa troglodytarum TaxID=320322 RepID=A0A9E7EPT5_9LILI|nr:Amidohydrolase family [Musa troglodytarum]